VDGLFRQSGVIRADTIDEMFDVAACLDAQPLPAGHRVAIVTNAGGPGILAADACSAAGLTVDEFSEATRSRLASFLPHGQPPQSDRHDRVRRDGRIKQTLETLLVAEDIDAIIVIYTTVDPRRTDEVLSAIQDGVAAGDAPAARPNPCWSARWRRAQCPASGRQ
jgi:acyl-CoA synthetase (NDP forming)